MAGETVQSEAGLSGAGPSGAAQPEAGPVTAGPTRRTKIVWGALAISMSAMWLTLSALQGGVAPRADGMSVVPLLAHGAGGASVEAVLRTRAGVDHDRWRAIVVHSSGSHHGSPETIEAEHREMRLKGLGHHFVLGNGRGMDDGEVHVAWRWLDQLPGAHAAGPDAGWYNQHAISVCLVGNGDRGAFTDEQVRRLVQLTAFLAREFDIPEDRILLGSDIAGVSSPGQRFPEASFREQLAGLR